MYIFFLLQYTQRSNPLPSSVPLLGKSKSPVLHRFQCYLACKQVQRKVCMQDICRNRQNSTMLFKYQLISPKAFSSHLKCDRKVKQMTQHQPASLKQRRQQNSAPASHLEHLHHNALPLYAYASKEYILLMYVSFCTFATKQPIRRNCYGLNKDKQCYPDRCLPKSATVTVCT